MIWEETQHWAIEEDDIGHFPGVSLGECQFNYLNDMTKTEAEEGDYEVNPNWSYYEHHSK